ncbi:MAG: hypothetical protein JXR77_08255, partial [Lentisphaeria bacterium]|nr:hypothetical protein [Lentisphaeria bacterium]
MAEENRAAEPQAQAGDSTKTVMVLAIVLICILAVFMVTSLNKMKLELIRLNQQIDTLVTATGQNSLGAFQAVDKDGNLQFKFVPIPME